jgi:hypothetical protein
MVRGTLHHGDFAPWNIRAINVSNVQVFDWERGNLRGIPGWDWFHFIIQTAILARRLSAECVAAEVEQLLLSPRFEKYAAVAGIGEIARPLALGYLLHHQWAVRPREGGQAAGQLFDLLAERWGFQPQAREGSPQPRRRAGAVQQLKTAAARLRNAFWEPSLSFHVRPPLAEQLAAHWPVLLICALLLAAVVGANYLASSSLIFLPF